MLKLDIGTGAGMKREFTCINRDDLMYTAIDPAEDMLKFTPKYVATLFIYDFDKSTFLGRSI